MVIVDILMILFICVFIINESGFIQSIEDLIKRTIPKPFSCSACMSFWLVSGYMLYNEYTIILSLFAGCSSAFASPIMNVLLELIIDLVQILTKKIYERF